MIPVTTIQAALKRDFEGSPLKGKAVFRVTKSDKKYPFHVTGVPVRLEIEVENVGPGYATEVEVAILDISA
ncbi:MAG: hypothetical protein ACJ74Z_17170, partial [Bryobacteraceae bacterium]